MRYRADSGFRDDVEQSFRLSAALPRIIAGITAAAASLAAALYIFGPFSDLSARQLAAGPNSTQRGPDNTPLVLARTGRSWASAAKHSDSQPRTTVALLARSDSRASDAR